VKEHLRQIKGEEGGLWSIHGTKRTSSFWNVKCEEEWRVEEEAGEVSRGQTIRIFLPCEGV
jgi:hypothetical protein